MLVAAADIPALVGLFCFPAADIMHDRYTYLSSIAFMLLLAWGLRHLPSSGAKAFGLPAEGAVALLAIGAVWAVLSAEQTLVWRNGFSLYSHTVAISPHNVRARNLLANQLVETGHLPQALELYEATLREEPDAWETNFSLGLILATDGKLAQGERLLRHACEVNPKSPDTYLVLAEVLRAENRREDARGVLRDGISKVNNGSEDLRRKLITLE